MNVFILMAAAENEGQVAQIARTFGVDWQHWARKSSASPLCAPSFTSSLTGVSSRCWSSGVNKSR